MHMLEFQTDDDAGNGKNRWVVHTSPITSMRGLVGHHLWGCMVGMEFYLQLHLQNILIKCKIFYICDLLQLNFNFPGALVAFETWCGH